VSHRPSLADELNIRIILEARKEIPEAQAVFEKALGGLDLSRYERPYAHFTEAQLLRYIRRKWRSQE
jgi:hypothetical protein